MATKPVADLVVGDQVPCIRTITAITKTATSVKLTFNDGTVQTEDLTGDPSIEVVGG